VNTFTPPPLSAFPGRAPADYSYGLRMLGTGTGAASYVKGFMLKPTPGELNCGYTVSGVTAEPAILGGDSLTVPRAALTGRLFRSGEFKAEVVPADAQCLVTYTLDGTEPDVRSEMYTEPLTIRSTCTLRVRAFGADRLPSQSLTRTFVLTPAALAAWYLPEEGRKVAAAYGLTPAPPRDALAGTTDILDQLEKVPSIFITWPPYELDADFFQVPLFPAGTGADGVPHYRASFEYYDPACPADYRQENCFIQVSPEEDNGQVCAKHTWDVLFDPAATIGGLDRWTGPVTTAGGAPCSKVFPGSKVTAWPGLLLRSMGRNSFQFCEPAGGGGGQGSEPIDAETYMSDAWMRYLQEQAATAPMPPEVAPRSDVVPQRRFVQLWFNGRYHGVYDLNEPPTRETISAHLLSRLPANATQAQRDALKPSFIEFLSPCATSQSANAETVWLNEVKNPCFTAKQTPNPTTYAAATAHLDMEAYVRHCAILEYLYPTETFCSYRAWRHPTDQKWRFISWEADDCTFGNFSIWNRTRYLSANPTTQALASQPHNLQPLYYLKALPGFQNLFSAHLSLIIPALFDQPATENRWITEAQKFRDILESEAMRWGSLAALDQWSLTEPYSGSLTTSRGIERYRRLMGNKDLLRLGNNVHESNALFNLLTVAVSQGLYTGDPDEYQTPYSNP
jgi:hypothetical protein